MLILVHSGCEVKAGAALIASARLFHSAVRHDLFYGVDDSWNVSVMAFRQDATNSKLKQCHMELETGILSGNTSELQANDISWDSFEISRFISDVIPVAESDGLATVGMTLKMLQSLGCTTWQELKIRKEELAKREVASASALASKSPNTAQLTPDYLATVSLGCFHLLLLNSLFGMWMVGVGPVGRYAMS